MATTMAVPEGLKTALAALDPARMLTLTEKLCVLDFAGRRVGTAGHARASAFLVEQFRQLGWTVTTQGFAVPVPAGRSLSGMAGSAKWPRKSRSERKEEFIALETPFSDF